MLRSHTAGSLRATDAGQTVTLAGWVARRRDHGGVIFIDLRDASGVAQVVFRDADVLAQAHRLRAEFCVAVTGVVEIRPEGNANAGDRHRRDRGQRHHADGAGGERAAAVPARRDRRRGGPAAVPLPGPAPRGPGQRNPVALQGECRRPRCAGRARLRRDRDADADPLDPGGRPRLPGARPAAARLVLRAAAEPAAVQAAADGGRHGALLPDRPLLPRRGFPRRPPAGVHPARHGDELRRRRRRHRGLRGGAAGGVGADRLRPAVAAAADQLRRRDAPVRFRQARPAVRRSNSSSAPSTSPTPRSGCSRRRTSARSSCRAGPRSRAARWTAGRSSPSSAATRGWPTCWSPRTARWAARSPRTCPTPSATGWPRTSAPSRGTACSSRRARRRRRGRCWVPPASRSPSGWT